MLNIYNNCDTPSPSLPPLTLSRGWSRVVVVGGGVEWGRRRNGASYKGHQQKLTALAKFSHKKYPFWVRLMISVFFAPSSVTRRERMKVITQPCPRDTLQRRAGTREATPVNWISLAQTGGCMQFLHLTDRPFSRALACRNWAGV